MPFTTEQIYRHYKVISVSRKEDSLVEWEVVNRITVGADPKSGTIATFLTKASAYDADFSSKDGVTIGSVRDEGEGLKLLPATFDIIGGVNEGDCICVDGTLNTKPFTKNITFPSTMHGSKMTEFIVKRINTVDGIYAAITDTGKNNITVRVYPKEPIDVVTLTRVAARPVARAIPPNP